MSRSYRKPWVVCGNGTRHKKYAKKEANRLIRRTKNIPDGKAYRKFYETWNIDDYRYPVNVKYPEDAFYQKDFWRYNRK